MLLFLFAMQCCVLGFNWLRRSIAVHVYVMLWMYAQWKLMWKARSLAIAVTSARAARMSFTKTTTRKWFPMSHAALFNWLVGVGVLGLVTY